MRATGKYYAEKLSAERLKKVYDIAPRRIEEYLNAEIDFCLQYISASDIVLELGCGYGRALKKIAHAAEEVYGIDISDSNLRFGKEYLKGHRNCSLFVMNASETGFKSGVFDVVLCIQNGISAFGIDKENLIEEAVRLTKPGGYALFSSYAEEFWNERLNWFEIQSEAGLLGKIDRNLTGEGVIVCNDGFRAGTISEREYAELVSKTGFDVEIKTVNSSSVFLVIRKTQTAN